MSDEHGPYAGVVDVARNGIDEVIRLRALNAELVEALRACREMVGHADNVAFIDAALAKAKAREASK